MSARNVAIAALVAGVLTVVWIGRQQRANGGSQPAAVAEAKAHVKLTGATPLPELLAALKDPDYGILAAVLIGDMDPLVVTPPLLVALKDEDSQARRHAAMALGKLGEAISTPELRDMKHMQIVPALIEAMKDTSADARLRVIEALGLLGDKSTVTVVAEALHAGDERLRQRAFEALNRMLSPSSGGLSPDREVEAANPEPATGDLSGESTVDELLAALQGSYYGIHAAVLLTHRGPTVATPALLTALQHGDARSRRHAAMALGLLGDRSAVPALIEAVEDGDAYVRYRVIEALESLGDTSAIPALEQALRYGESWQRSKAAEALSALRR